MFVRVSTSCSTEREELSASPLVVSRVSDLMLTSSCSARELKARALACSLVSPWPKPWRMPAGVSPMVYHGGAEVQDVSRRAVRGRAMAMAMALAGVNRGRWPWGFGGLFLAVNSGINIPIILLTCLMYVVAGILNLSQNA